MSGRKIFHVVYRKNMPENKRWAVKSEMSKRASSTHRKKTAATNKAKKMARRNKPAEVIVHKRDGKINRRSTYRDDPHPPKG